METVRSENGTQIAYERTGSGPPLVLVHGTSADHTSWSGIRPALEEHATVYAIDRRGRGESGDSAEYHPEREFEDVASVVDSLDEPAVLFGHSFGALCALEAALRTDDLCGMVLYEPTLGDVEPDYYSEETYAEMETWFADGEPERVLVLYLQEVIGLPGAAVDQLRSASTWASRVAAAHTVLREYRAPTEYTFDAPRFGSVHTPALLMVGSESFRWARDATDVVAEALPDCRVVELEDQGHLAYATAPDRFTEELLRFVRESN